MQTRTVILLDDVESDCCESGVLEPNVCNSCHKLCKPQCEECHGTGKITWQQPNYRGDDMEQIEQACLCVKIRDDYDADGQK